MEKENCLCSKFLQGYYDTPAIERLATHTYLVPWATTSRRQGYGKGHQMPSTVEANNWYVASTGWTPSSQGATPEQPNATASCGRAGHRD